MSPLVSRILVGAALLPVVLGLAWLGGWWLTALAAVAAVLALHEFYSMTRSLRPLVLAGYVAALLVLAAIVVVQQVERHILYPLLMGRTVHLHPAVILVALGVGGIVAGVIGVFLAVPVAGIISVILSYAREEPHPSSPVADAPAVPAVPAVPANS